MSLPDLRFSINFSSYDNLLEHLNNVKHLFDPPLDKIIVLEEYALKLINYAVRFEVWNNKDLIGLLAAYFNDPNKQTAFITNVSVISQFSGNGIAKRLLVDCYEYGKLKKFSELKLEVRDNNFRAIALYKSNGFEELDNYNNILVLQKKII